MSAIEISKNLEDILNEGAPVIMTAEEFRKIVDSLARERAGQLRQRKPLTSLEAMEMLGMGKTRFYSLVRDPRTKIKKMGNSRYSLDSIEKEKERLEKIHG